MNIFHITIATLLLGAPLAQAQSAARPSAFAVCAVCHSVEAGVPSSRLGPNLHGVVGRHAAAAPDFNYSAAMRSLDAEWTPERLDEFLARPNQIAPGNRMAFAGVSNPEQRRAIISYLEAH